MMARGMKVSEWKNTGKVACLAAFVLFTANAQAGLVGYWDFDSYTTGSNPPGMPNGANQGSFADVSGNGNTAYGAEFSPLDYVPYDATGGKWGGAFYSANNNNNGALAVVADSADINFNQEDFSISFWEKVKYRDVAAGGWGAGRGRSQFFTKAPYIPAEDPNVTKKGYGLNLTQNHFDLLTNMDDNYAQTSLGARYTFPSGTTPAYDSGVWAHWAITGQYNAGTDDYTITTYLNGTAVDWDGAAGTTITVANDIIDNNGDLTIGSFFRNNGYATQRFISWNMSTDQSTDPGEGWMDDFALWDEVLDSATLAGLADGSIRPLDTVGGAAAAGTLIYGK